MWSAALALCTQLSCLQPPDCVILLHGLARTERAMRPLEHALSADGYRVINQRYPSRQFDVVELSQRAIEPAVQACRDKPVRRIHFVTHSLGGVLVRLYLRQHVLDELGSVVMLAPPNQGSEVVDRLKDVWGMRQIGGPAFAQLGTDAESVPRQLGPVHYSVGVIAGTRSVNPILSLTLPGPDDGKVTVASTQVAGMRDFIALPVTHPFMMRRGIVIAAVRQFLQTGHFTQGGADSPRAHPSSACCASSAAPSSPLSAPSAGAHT